MNALDHLIQADYEAGTAYAAEWWRTAETSGWQPHRFYDRASENGHAALLSGDAATFSRLLGIADYLADRLDY